MIRMSGTPAAAHAANVASARSPAMLMTSTPASRIRSTKPGSRSSASAGVTCALSRTGTSAPVQPSPATSGPSSSAGSAAQGLVKTDQVWVMGSAASEPAHGDTADEPALRQEEDDDQRDGGDRRGHQQQVPLGAVGVLEGLQADGDGAGRVGVGDHQRPEQV